MKAYAVDKICNLGLISHGGAGKTTLAEAMLFTAGVIDRRGNVEEGTSTLDHDPEEVKRKITITTAIAPCPFGEHKVNIVDTPGYFDFVGEVRAALRVTDGALVLFDAVGGVEVGSELVWRYADEYEIPRLAVINKLDRENADFDKVLAAVQAQYEAQVVALQLPVGSEANFRGVIDLIDKKAFIYATDGSGKFTEEEVPADLAGQADELREQLVEAAAEGDDSLVEKYMEGEELSPEEIRRGLRVGVLARRVVPVLCAAGGRNIGMHHLLQAAVDYLPSPADCPPVKGTNPKNDQDVEREASADAPLCALVFKTMADPYVGKLSLFRVYSGRLKSDTSVYNASSGKSERVGQVFLIKGKNQEAVNEVGVGDLAAVAKLQATTTGDTLVLESDPIVLPRISFPAPTYSVAVEPKAKGDEEKISSGLTRLAEEDPTFRVEKSPDTGELIMSGMGEMHLEVLTDRLRRKFGADVVLKPPRIPYRETIRGSVKVEGKHKKQTGGRGQFGHVWLEMAPDPGNEFTFEEKLFGGSVPRQYVPAVEKGVREAMSEGILAGYPVTGVKVTLYDGSYHTVDSSEIAFKIAASMAFKKGADAAKPVLLEPVGNVEVTIPDQFTGDVIGDLNKKRGRIQGMEPRGNFQVVRAQVPMAEMSRYAIDLRSITQGRGLFTLEFSHYEEAPGNVVQQVVEQAQREKEEG